MGADRRHRVGPAVAGPRRAAAADAARQARGVLAALGDPDDELTATPAMRNRIEGAAVALETVAAGDPMVPPTG